MTVLQSPPLAMFGFPFVQREHSDSRRENSHLAQSCSLCYRHWQPFCGQGVSRSILRHSRLFKYYTLWRTAANHSHVVCVVSRYRTVVSEGTQSYRNPLCKFNMHFSLVTFLFVVSWQFSSSLLSHLC